ncbi:MAG: sodium:proton antiporter [Phycisphaerales bacterium]|nr:sodium:proton antiporter [Phycisphaerales bacterium]
MVCADSILTLGAGGGAGIGTALTAVLLLGIGAQWVAWRLKIPSILLLLIFGLLAGPVMRQLTDGGSFSINPDEIFGSDLLLALVGISVGMILYEGGLTLKFSEVRSSWRSVAMMVTVGAFVTWMVALLSAKWILGLSTPIATLLGAVLIVTGPTVIGPMLSHIRPSGASGLILKWEGIVIDPIGVAVAVLVFEAIVAQPGTHSLDVTINAILTTLVAGILLGVASALLLKEVLNRYLVPDYLQNPVSLMLVIATFTASNMIYPESGLLATTVMGIVLVNQKKVDIHHILEFKENLRVLLISVLFIVLAARLRIEDLQQLDWIEVFGFIGVLIVVARPLGVFLSTLGAGLRWQERIFLCLMAPRGIVAAAAASIFALGLEKAEIEGFETIVPLTFSVIIGTVAFYGLTAPWAARKLGVSDPNPQGVLFIGASGWVRGLAMVLQKRGIRVHLIDTNRSNIRHAVMNGLPATYGNVLTMGDLTDIDLRGIGRVFANTPNDEVNTLVLQSFKGYFDSSSMYRLTRKVTKSSEAGKAEGMGRILFDEDLGYSDLEDHLHDGWVIKATNISNEFSFEDYKTLYGSSAVALCTMRDGVMSVCTVDSPAAPVAGDTIISLVNPDELFMLRAMNENDPTL